MCNVLCKMHVSCVQRNAFNPRACKGGRGGGGGWHKVFLEFVQDDFSSAPAVFSRSTLVP